MKKIKIGIVGYGNLGKALEEHILQNENCQLVGIFSRHTKNVGLTNHDTQIFPYAKLERYKQKIDTIFLCVGSHKDCEKIAKEVLKNFNMVDCFDTHAKMTSYLSALDKTAKENNKIGISAFGWDPGIFSLFRVMFNMISHSEPITFWGEGVSQGHSEVLRKIEGVKNAIQFTIPQKRKVLKHKKSFEKLYNLNQLHKRLCYISLHKKYNDKKYKKIIIEKIKSTKNYFQNQKIIIKFKNEKTILKKQNKLFHQGKIINNFMLSNKYKNNLFLNLKMQSNPHFTANVMIKGIYAIKKLTEIKKYGNFSILELPIYYFFNEEKNSLIKKYV